MGVFLFLGAGWASNAWAATVPEGFNRTLVASGITSPTALAFAPDGRLFICQQNGKLRVVRDGALLSQPFLTVTTDATGERGLLGVAFHPSFVANPWVYVYYTVPGRPSHNRVSRFRAESETASPDSEQVLLELDELSDTPNHNGGALRFGVDGKLYIAVGDNARSFKAPAIDNLLGKILRLNPDGTIPEDNPFYTAAVGVNRAIWALGLRNPYTLAVQPNTGRIFINEVGEISWEEINEGFEGADFGWPAHEGVNEDEDEDVSPLFAYEHGNGPDEGCAITGGTFYNPTTTDFPARYVGKYFFMDYCNGWMRVLDPDDPESSEAFASGLEAPVGLEVGPDGALYFLTRDNGSLNKIQATAKPGIVAQPEDRSVLPGTGATFAVSASGAEPLRYQWQRDGTNISGATNASYTLMAPQLADSGDLFSVLVSNDHGSVASDEALLLVTTNSPPTVTISQPLPTLKYRGGDTIKFAGNAQQNGQPLPASAYVWTVVFHHAQHTHPFLGPLVGFTNGSFVIPTSGETASDVFYQIQLSVMDESSMGNSASVDLQPQTSRMTLVTSPPGLRVTLGGQPVITPVTVTGVVGVARSLGVLSPQAVNGTNFGFARWSDGGAAVHGIATPETDTTFRADFVSGTDRPPLNLAQAGNQMLLSWPSITTGFVVQATHSLEPTIPWSTATNRITTNEAWCGAVVNVAQGSEFFRLASTNLAETRLYFARTNVGLYLRWPTQAAGALQSTPSLTPVITWDLLTNSVEIIDEQQQVTVPLTRSNRYFRLMKP